MVKRIVNRILNSQHTQPSTQIISGPSGRHAWQCRAMHTRQDIQHTTEKLIKYTLHPATRIRRHLVNRRARTDRYIKARVHLGNPANHQLHRRRTYPPASPSLDNDWPIDRNARFFDQISAFGECSVQRCGVRGRLPRTLGLRAIDNRPLHCSQRAAQN